ncbi:hypothetical protein [Flavobacterium sp.]|uniref:hypothetical protein n=1 Tax=Flavobacterium sp. TaxID=239 RepID=UPI0031DBB447
MKTKNSKKEINKFDLEKFSVAKLKNMRAIKGGGTPVDDDPKTVTDTIDGGDRKA